MKFSKGNSLTLIFIFIAFLLAGFNFLIFNNIESIKPADVSNLASLFQKSINPDSKATATNILPDIKVGQAYASSGSRNSEIANLANRIPYTDPQNNFLINYNGATKDITVSIPKSANLAEYRDKKHLAEFKLQELGANDLCLLLIYWAPPASLKSQLTTKDGVTTGCSR